MSNNKRREAALALVKAMLTASRPREEWTECRIFKCVHNTGWAAGDDKYLCRLGKDAMECGVKKQR